MRSRRNTCSSARSSASPSRADARPARLWPDGSAAARMGRWCVGGYPFSGSCFGSRAAARSIGPVFFRRQPGTVLRLPTSASATAAGPLMPCPQTGPVLPSPKPATALMTTAIAESTRISTSPRIWTTAVAASAPVLPIPPTVPSPASPATVASNATPAMPTATASSATVASPRWAAPRPAAPAEWRVRRPLLIARPTVRAFLAA